MLEFTFAVRFFVIVVLVVVKLFQLINITMLKISKNVMIGSSFAADEILLTEHDHTRACARTPINHTFESKFQLSNLHKEEF